MFFLLILNANKWLLSLPQALQQELAAREQTIAAMKSASNLPSMQLDELNRLWDSVNQLSDLREAKLKESLQLVNLIL